MTPQEIFDKLVGELGPEALPQFDAGSAKVKDAFCDVAPAELHRVCEHMKTDPDLAFDYLECLTGIDLPKEKQIQVVYHLFSYAKRHRLVLKVGLDRDDPVVESVTDLWSAANWQERECFDLLGVMFDGHPDLRRLLLPDDWEGHPLRKDWKEQADYHGIPTTRPSPLEMIGKDLKAKADAAKAVAKPAEKAPAPKADGKEPAAKKKDEA